MTYFIYLISFIYFCFFEQLLVLLSISRTERLKCNRLGHTSPPHSPLIICHIAYKRESGRIFAV